jgi:hypothetical protein
MKKDRLLYNADNPPKELNEKSAEQSSQSKTPYLKAILSGKTKSFSLENNLPVNNSDRIAALRYIRESTFLRKLYVDKMSC